MKILQLISGNLGQGGAERLVIDLSEAQANLGHEVTICSFRTPTQAVIESLPKNVKFNTFGKAKGASIGLPFQLAKYIWQEHFDVVNCHLPAVYIYILLAMAICRKTRFAYTIHSNPEEEEPRKWVRKMRRVSIRQRRVTFIGISEKISKRFKALYTLNEDVPIVENGRKQQNPSEQWEDVKKEVKGYCRDEDTRVLVVVGRLTREKNHILMLQAMAQLQTENIVLLILGKDYDGFLEKHQQDIPNNVHLLGGKSNVYDYLSCADCFVMSSLYEGLPISILEAYSAGLPVVSTPVGGIPDVVTDGKNGFLSTGMRVEDYVAAIERYLRADEETMQRMRETNKKLFNERFDIRQTAQRYIELYEKNKAIKQP